MDFTDFNYNYLKKLLENISKKQESIFLLGDFNVNLLIYNEHNQTNEFLDSLASKSFIPLILQPTRITSHSNTLIDNIFPNVIEPDIRSGNFTATIFHHLPQFAIIRNILAIYQAINITFMKGTGQILIEKILSLTISLLTGKIC